MAKEMTYENTLEADEFVYNLLAANPIGKYHRMEDIYDDVLVLARVDAEKAYAADGKKWPETLEGVRAAGEPFMMARYMRFVDEDRDALLKELARRGIDETKALDAFINALNKIRAIDDKKEVMDALAENAYAKCAFNLALYEFLM